MSKKTEDQNDDPIEKPTKEEPLPELHDCILCPPKEKCKHTVPLHETIKSLVRGNAGVEDLFLKINEIAEWMIAAGMTLKPKNKSKS